MRSVPQVANIKAASVQELVNQIDRLVAFPDVWIRINQLIREERGATEIARAVEMDTDLSARLLRIVNSACYRLAAPVDTISRAVTLIGTRELRDLTMITVARRLFTGIPRELMDVQRFWRMAVATGVFGTLLGRRCHMLHHERAFVLGMLQDIGVLAICQYLPNQAREILLIAGQDPELLPGAELEVLGYTHQAVGSALLGRWGLPASLVEVAAHHHEPHRATVFRLEVAVMHVANLLAGGDGLGLDRDAILERVQPCARDLLPLSPDLLDDLLDRGREQVDDMVDRFLAASTGARRHS